jgi:hypothetical protein
MLKPADPTPPRDERPIGEIVGDIVDEGKAYARAELKLARAIATAKARSLKTPAILLVTALFVGMAALNALAVGIMIALALVMSPILAALLSFALIGGVAALLAWFGVEKLRNLK